MFPSSIEMLGLFSGSSRKWHFFIATLLTDVSYILIRIFLFYFFFFFLEKIPQRKFPHNFLKTLAKHNLEWHYFLLLWSQSICFSFSWILKIRAINNLDSWMPLFSFVVVYAWYFIIFQFFMAFERVCNWENPMSQIWIKNIFRIQK